jgi:hypothetical protein
MPKTAWPRKVPYVGCASRIEILILPANTPLSGTEVTFTALTLVENTSPQCSPSLEAAMEKAFAGNSQEILTCSSQRSPPRSMASSTGLRSSNLLAQKVASLVSTAAKAP